MRFPVQHAAPHRGRGEGEFPTGFSRKRPSELAARGLLRQLVGERHPRAPKNRRQREGWISVALPPRGVAPRSDKTRPRVTVWRGEPGPAAHSAWSARTTKSQHRQTAAVRPAPAALGGGGAWRTGGSPQLRLTPVPALSGGCASGEGKADSAVGLGCCHRSSPVCRPATASRPRRTPPLRMQT